MIKDKVPTRMDIRNALSISSALNVYSVVPTRNWNSGSSFRVTAGKIELILYILR